MGRRKHLHLVALCSALAVAGIVSRAKAGVFGTYCQADYQNSWQPSLPYGYDVCSGFNDTLDDLDTKLFYFNTQGAKPYYEQANDQDLVERVSLFFSSTHGAVDATTGHIYMWDYGQTAQTAQMRLGDEALGTRIMANYSCHLLDASNGAFWTRWAGVAKGGLKYVTGSHDTIWFSWFTSEVGADFAYNIQHSQAIKYAWRDGIADWYYDQDIAVASFGSGSTDCTNRLNNMTWQNFDTNFPIIRDSQVYWWCQSQWTDY
jgi:hypothetical protein